MPERAAERVITAITNVECSLRELSEDVRKSKKTAKAAIATLAVAVVLLIFGGYTTSQNQKSADRSAKRAIEAAHAVAMSACEQTNKYNEGFIRYIDEVVVPTQLPPDATPEQLANEERRTRFSRIAHQIFVQQDCSQVTAQADQVGGK